MQCPVCNERLREVNKNGLLINVCADCKGAWIERPELERLFAANDRNQDDRSRFEDRRYREHDDDHGDHSRGDRGHGDHDSDDRHGDYRQGGRRKREGFFGNLMDMFGD